MFSISFSKNCEKIKGKLLVYFNYQDANSLWLSGLNIKATARGNSVFLSSRRSTAFSGRFLSASVLFKESFFAFSQIRYNATLLECKSKDETNI